MVPPVARLSPKAEEETSAVLQVKVVTEYTTPISPPPSISSDSLSRIPLIVEAEPPVGVYVASCP